MLFKTRRETRTKRSEIQLPGENAAVPQGDYHASEWQAMFMHKFREIECNRRVWLTNVEELGGFVEHIYEEGHREVSFDDFIMMLKAVAGADSSSNKYCWAYVY